MTYEPQQSVVVPIVLGAGLVFTLLMMLQDSLRRHLSQRNYGRRPGVYGTTAARAAQQGIAAAQGQPTGLRSRWLYLLVAVGSMTLGIYLTIGAWANFLGATWWSENIAWLAVVLQTFALLFIGLGAVLLVTAWRYGRPPSWLWPLLASTPLGKRPSGVRPPPDDQRLRLRLLGHHHITDRVAAVVRGLAVIWSLIVVSVFSWLAFNDRIPRAEGGTSVASELATGLQIAMLILFTLGALVAWRWESGGAVMMAVAALLLALLASVQYPPEVAVGVLLAFGAPAFLHWLAWQRDHGVLRIGGLAVITAITITLVWGGSTAIAAYYLGPQHPETAAAPLPDSPVEWIWAGGTTATATSVVTSVPADASVRIAISKRPDLTNPQYRDGRMVALTDQLVVRARFAGLRPNTRYYYAAEVNGSLDLIRTGQLRTFPKGASDFSMAVAACARTGSNGAVFDSIAAKQPLVYINAGDFHYANIDGDEPWLFRDALNRTLSSTSQSALYRSTSTAYVWDDHDYSGNDANETSRSASAAETVYREFVPHYPMPATGNPGAIYQAFTAGRVRVLLTDNRATRTPQEEPDTPQKYMLGPEQEQWLLAELTAAADTHGVVIWVNPDPWIDPVQEGGDGWGGYTNQRQRIADAIAELGLSDRLVMVSGDAHMVALDDGSNSDYSISQAGGFPVLHAAALDRIGGYKGGPYSGGIYPGAGQYGLVDVVDDGGDEITVKLSGHTWEDQVLVSQAFDLRATP